MPVRSDLQQGITLKRPSVAHRASKRISNCFLIPLICVSMGRKSNVDVVLPPKHHIRRLDMGKTYLADVIVYPSPIL